MIKKSIYLIFSIILLVVSFIVFDLTNIDNKFVNRSIVHVDVKNLSSKYTKQLFTKLRLYYLQSFELFAC